VDRSDASQRKTLDPWDIGFSVFVLASALLAIFVWFPLDIKGGFFNITPLGKVEPGDAFFPSLLAVSLALLSVLQLAISLLKGSPPPRDAEPSRLSSDNFRFLAIFLSICAIGLAMMYTLGPAVVWVMREIGATDASYRQLTDTAPYKYIGYVLGGLFITLTLIGWTEGRLRRGAIIAVFAVLFVAIGIFDGLLSNVLLPPNADY